MKEMMLRFRKNIMQWERPVVAASVVPQLLYHQKCMGYILCKLSHTQE